MRCLAACFQRAIRIFRNPGSGIRGNRKKLPLLEQLERLNLMTISAAWFPAFLHDPTIESLALSDWKANDESLSREDVIGILNAAANNSTVTATELLDLRALSANSAALGMAPAVQNLLSKTVGYNLANKEYQGQTLLASGELSVHSTGAEITDLVNKWFLGLDHPALTPGKQNEATYAEASGTLYGTDNQPVPTDIEQGDVGDCYFLSSLGAIAERMPTTIESMIQSNGDGTYTVEFHDGSKPDYVTVDSEFPVDSSGTFVYADYGQSATSPDNILWPMIIEKAYAQLSEEGWSRAYADTPSLQPVAWDQNSYLSISLGNPGIAMHQISGLPATWVNLATPATSSQKKQLIADLTANEPITICTTGREHLRHGIVQNHVYMLLSYDPTTKKFHLLNPYDDGKTKKQDGHRHESLKWKKLVANFEGYGVVILPNNAAGAS